MDAYTENSLRTRAYSHRPEARMRRSLATLPTRGSDQPARAKRVSEHCGDPRERGAQHLRTHNPGTNICSRNDVSPPCGVRAM